MYFWGFFPHVFFMPFEKLAVKFDTQHCSFPQFALLCNLVSIWSGDFPWLPHARFLASILKGNIVNCKGVWVAWQDSRVQWHHTLITIATACTKETDLLCIQLSNHQHSSSFERCPAIHHLPPVHLYHRRGGAGNGRANLSYFVWGKLRSHSLQLHCWCSYCLLPVYGSIEWHYSPTLTSYS